MNIRHQRHRAFIHQLAHGGHARIVIYGYAHDIAALACQGANLQKRTRHITGVGIGHGLYGYACAAAQRHGAHHHRSRFHGHFLGSLCKDIDYIVEGEVHHHAQQQQIARQVNIGFHLAVDRAAEDHFKQHKQNAAAV